MRVSVNYISSCALMGNFCQSSPASPPLERIVPSPSKGSNKYGPYIKDPNSKGYILSRSQLELPSSFEKESELRTWLLNHITIKDQTGEHIVRKPGTMNGAQCIISDCTDCTIYILDHTSTVSIDRCKNCHIFIGPCDSSTFVRDCHDSNFIIATRQLRTRGCKNNAILLYCGTEPVIEKTKKLRLGCFQGNYFDLNKQLDTCALSPYHNLWHQVHDFTPGNGTGENYTFLNRYTTGLDLGFTLTTELKEEIQLDNTSQVDTIPSTIPTYQYNKLCRPAKYCLTVYKCLVTFAPTIRGMQEGRKFIDTAVSKKIFMNCKHQTMYKEQYNKLPMSKSKNQDNKQHSKLHFAACVVRPEVDGTDASIHPKTLAVVVESSYEFIKSLLQTDQEYKDWMIHGDNDWLNQWKMEV